MLRGAVLATILSLTPLAAAAAADTSEYQSGLAAFQAGNFQQAHRKWTVSAKAGHAESEYRIGLLPREGKGARQGLPTAAGWFSRAHK